MNPKRQVNEDRPLKSNSKSVHIVLPGYRGPFAANDFIDMEVRAVDEAIVGYVSRHTIRTPWTPPREVVFQIATEEPDSEKEDTTIRAYRDLFKYQSNTHWRSFTDQLPLTVALATIGMFMLWVSNEITGAQLQEGVKKTLSDIVQVGAWVAMWTAIAELFSVGFLSLQKYFAFRRLAHTRMKFVYSPQGTLVERQVASRPPSPRKPTSRATTG